MREAVTDGLALKKGCSAFAVPVVRPNINATRRRLSFKSKCDAGSHREKTRDAAGLRPIVPAVRT